jgi:hypothetical protein
MIADEPFKMAKEHLFLHENIPIDTSAIIKEGGTKITECKSQVIPDLRANSSLHVSLTNIP